MKWGLFSRWLFYFLTVLPSFLIYFVGEVEDVNEYFKIKTKLIKILEGSHSYGKYANGILNYTFTVLRNAIKCVGT